MSSPTQRSLEELRRQGWTVGVVEKVGKVNEMENKGD
jgi:hypothetical protein